MKEVLQRAIKDAIEQMGFERFKQTSFFGTNYKPKENEMDKVEQNEMGDAIEKGGPWLTVEEALQATGGLPFTQEDRGRATQWLEGNCHLVRHWTLPKILAAYAAHVTAEKDKEIARLRVVAEAARAIGDFYKDDEADINMAGPLFSSLFRALSALDGEKE